MDSAAGVTSDAVVSALKVRRRRIRGRDGALPADACSLSSSLSDGGTTTAPLRATHGLQATKAKVLILPSKLPFSIREVATYSGDGAAAWGTAITSDAPDLQMIVQDANEVDTKVRGRA